MAFDGGEKTLTFALPQASNVRLKMAFCQPKKVCLGKKKGGAAYLLSVSQLLYT